jgi:hypothetical protein
VAVTLACFAIGGLIYGPFIPLTYAQFQSSTTTARLPAVLAARGALILVSTPLGTAVGGPLVGGLGADQDARSFRSRDRRAGDPGSDPQRGPEIIPRVSQSELERTVVFDRVVEF